METLFIMGVFDRLSKVIVFILVPFYAFVYLFKVSFLGGISFNFRTLYNSVLASHLFH